MEEKIKLSKQILNIISPPENSPEEILKVFKSTYLLQLLLLNDKKSRIEFPEIEFLRDILWYFLIEFFLIYGYIFGIYLFFIYILIPYLNLENSIIQDRNNLLKMWFKSQSGQSDKEFKYLKNKLKLNGYISIIFNFIKFVLIFIITAYPFFIYKYHNLFVNFTVENFLKLSKYLIESTYILFLLKLNGFSK